MNKIQNPPGKALWLNLGLLLMTLLFIAIFLELAARTYSWKMGKGFWTRPHSFTSPFFVTYDWPSPIIQGDEGRFRTGQTVAMKKKEKELRIMCLGGSTTVNAYNKEGLTYSREVQDHLRKEFPDLDLKVLNAGSEAFSTAHSLVNLSLRLLDFEPDIITVYHNINDLTANRFGEHLHPDYANKYLDHTFLAYEHRGGFGGTMFRLSRFLQMLKWKSSLVKNLLEKKVQRTGVKNPEKGPEVFRRNLESIIAIAKQHRIKVVLATQATLRGESGDFAAFNQVVKDCGRDNDVTVADVSKSMSGNQSYFVDRVHFTAAGVRAMANLFVEALTPEINFLLEDRVSGKNEF